MPRCKKSLQKRRFPSRYLSLLKDAEKVVAIAIFMEKKLKDDFRKIFLEQ
jgi:hypothetical protein